MCTSSYPAAAVAADYRLRIEAAKARLTQALLTRDAPAGALPPWSELVSDALDCLDGLAKPSGAQRYRAARAVARAVDSGESPLTPQQTAIVAALADGASRAEVADRLGLAENTVKQHLLRAKHRTGLSPRQLVAKALREGWVA